MLRLSDREYALVIVTAGISVVAGMWIGLWMVPDAALDVPTTQTHNGDSVPTYQPVPTHLPVLSAAIVGASVIGSYLRYLAPDPDDESEDVDDVEAGGESVAADGGEVRDER